MPALPASISPRLDMRLHKVEVNLRRLLEAAPRQQNQAKLVHYVTTAWELFEQLGADTASEGTSSVSKAKLSEYSEKIQALAARIVPSVPEDEKPIVGNREIGSFYEKEKEEYSLSLSSVLRRAHAVVGPNHNERKGDTGAPLKLDAEAKAHIKMHRTLQEDVTDDMLEAARELKENILMMNQSIKSAEKILDSTETSVENNLASISGATSRLVEVNSRIFNTTCFKWLIIFMTTCMFFMVVLLIRIT